MEGGQPRGVADSVAVQKGGKNGLKPREIRRRVTRVDMGRRIMFILRPSQNPSKRDRLDEQSRSRTIQ